MRDYLESHPSRVRGLKYVPTYQKLLLSLVAPLAGAWIEIYVIYKKKLEDYVSHPSRVRGLKFYVLDDRDGPEVSRTPRGCVD